LYQGGIRFNFINNTFFGNHIAMKKVLFIIFCLAILYSCESNRKTCWTCTTKIVFAFIDEEKETPLITTVRTDKCDLSKKEAKEFERLLTSIQIFKDDLISSIATTECVEKSNK
jgi:hypothetical protein